MMRSLLKGLAAGWVIKKIMGRGRRGRAYQDRD
jgi:hypothetical protein